MGSFSNGVLVGFGISLLIAPRKGEEMRRLIAERFRYMRGVPPENPRLQQSVQQMEQQVQEVQQMANQTAQMQSNAQDYAQQTAQRASTANTNISEVKQQAAPNQPQQQPQIRSGNPTSSGTSTTSNRLNRKNDRTRSHRRGGRL
jgi:gas vesicle protein